MVKTKKDQFLGKNFGTWTVKTVFSENGKSFAFCKCVCGKTRRTRLDYLSNKKEMFCSCLFRKHIGEKYGKLKILDVYIKPNSGVLFFCLCDCGKNKTIKCLHKLTSGHTKSCGCHKRSFNLKHGLTRSYIHNIYQNMTRRCHSPKSDSYGEYGAKGITVCDRWRENILNFIEDMGMPPTNKHSIDRIDNTKGYSKENCRWATSAEQARNKRTNRMYTVNGKTMCLHDWAREKNISATSITDRMKRGWSLERAINTPPNLKFLRGDLR